MLSVNYISIKQGLPSGSDSKEYAYNAGDLALIPGLGGLPGEGKGYPLQYSGLENFMDCSPWRSKESDMTERLTLSELEEKRKHAHYYLTDYVNVNIF